MVGILGVAAVVVDLGNARQIRREMQGGVDAASLAGAQDLPIPANNASTRLTKQSQARKTASDYAARNLVGPTSVGPDCTIQTGFTCTGTVGGRDAHHHHAVEPVDQLAARPTRTRRPTSGTSTCRRARTRRPSSPVWCSRASPRVCRSAVGRYTATGGGFDYGLVATNPTRSARR